MIPIVGSHVGRTWNSNTSSQLHGGYVKVVLPRKGLKICVQHKAVHLLLGLAFQNPLLFFSASTAKSVISGVKMEWGKGLYNIFDWCPQNGANTEIKLFAKASSFDAWYRCDTEQDKRIWQAAPALGPNYNQGRKIPFTLENREILNNFHV